MKKSDVFHNSLMIVLKQKFPRKSNLVNVLMDILLIEKEAVYRRINGKVPFSLAEIAQVAQEIGVSLDEIIELSTPKIRPFHMQFPEQINPTESDYAMLDEVVNILRNIKEESYSEGGEATNILPQPLYLMYENITKFFMFKWRYFENKTDRNPEFKDVSISTALRAMQIENAILAREISSTNYIFDRMIFRYLANDIKYFKMINLITDAEIELIKNDLFKIVNELNALTETGEFAETGNKVDIYISNINFPASYCYIQSPSFHITMIKAFLLNAIASTADDTFSELKKWIQSLRQQSIYITRSSEKEKIEFFREQRSIIEAM